MTRTRATTVNSLGALLVTLASFAAAQDAAAEVHIIWRGLDAYLAASKPRPARFDPRGLFPHIACVVEGESWGVRSVVSNQRIWVVTSGPQNGCQGYVSGRVLDEELIGRAWLKEQPTSTRPEPPHVTNRTLPSIQLQPWLTDDRKTLVLVREVRQPERSRQPEISLGLNPTTKKRELRISGQGLTAPKNIGMVCYPNIWWPLSQTTHSQTPERNTSGYQVSAQASEQILDAKSCYVAIANIVLPVPLELLSTAWGRKP